VLFLIYKYPLIVLVVFLLGHIRNRIAKSIAQGKVVRLQVTFAAPLSLVRFCFNSFSV
jgi:hypothetical protein